MTLNIENIKTVAAVIAAQEHTTIGDESGFTMADYTHSCGTPACIAGWAVAIKYDGMPTYQDRVSRSIGIYAEATDWLGLTGEQADDLFVLMSHDLELEGITPAHAVAALNHLAATGEVEWDLPGFDAPRITPLFEDAEDEE